MHMRKSTNSLIEIKSVSIRTELTHFQGFWRRLSQSSSLRNLKLMCNLIYVACPIEDIMGEI